MKIRKESVLFEELQLGFSRISYIAENIQRIWDGFALVEVFGGAESIGMGSRASFDATRDRCALANILDRWAERSFVPRNPQGVVLARRLR